MYMMNIYLISLCPCHLTSLPKDSLILFNTYDNFNEQKKWEFYLKFFSLTNSSLINTVYANWSLCVGYMYV